MFEILKGIPLPPKRQKQVSTYEPEVKYTQEQFTARIKELQEQGLLKEIKLLTDRQLRWRVSVNRWRNNERIL